MRPIRRPGVISRPEMPLIVRNPRERRPVWLIILLVLFLAWGFMGGKSGPADSLFSHSDLKVEAVSLRPVNSKSGTTWLVSGKLVNPTGETQTASDLIVRLRRSDGSVAAESGLTLQGQLMPAQSAVPFTTRLQTGPGEELSAEVSLTSPEAP